jgi:pimeloyl-ACP methyl ester carboxylesterase
MPGDTLTVGPNVQIRFSETGSFDVYGTVITDGSTGRVVMTSSADTGGIQDESSVTKWSGIIVREGGVLQLSDTDIRFAGRSGPAIMSYGSISADDLSITRYPGIGLLQKSGSTNLVNSEILGGAICVEHESGLLNLGSSAIGSCSYVGISSPHVGTVSINNVRFIDVSKPVMAEVSVNLSSQDTRIESSVPGYWNGFVRFGDLTADADWSVMDAVPIIQFMSVEPGAQLTIPAGMNIRFPANENLFVRGKLIVQGTSEEPVVFTSIRDDDYGEILFDGANTFAQPGDWGTISVEAGGSIDMVHAMVRNGGKPGLYSSSFAGSVMNMGGNLSLQAVEMERNSLFAVYHDSGTTTIAESVIEDNTQGIRANKGHVEVTQSSISGNIGAGIEGYQDSFVDARNNWWGSVTGPYDPDRNPSGLGDEVISSGTVLIDSWLSAPPGTGGAACCSSILFIPGFQASRMETQGSWFNNRLWEPNKNADVEKLYYDENGNPVHEDVGPTSVIDEAFGFNVYKSFLDFLMTDLVDTDDISEFFAAPYDWRKNPEDIATGYISILGGQTFTLAEKVEELASQSKTGKVTVVAHSNGGLIAKLLMNHLVDMGEDELVDQIILVAVPQAGTPKAIAGLLHGDGQTIPEKLGILLNQKTARELGYGIPGAYTLLPSAQYFAHVLDPVIEFTDEVKNIYDFQGAYGKNIDTLAELDNFLLGEGGVRHKPDASDTDNPQVLKENLLTQARATQDELSLWQAPPHVKVSQIVGWGLDTIRGIKYDDCDIPLCPQTLSHLDRELLLTIDGDKTVVVPSASMDKSASTYYVNLRRHNRENARFRRNRDHADILEAYPTQSVIKNLVIGKDDELPKHISTTTPQSADPENDEPALRVRIYSPVSLHLYDSEGNHTGIVNEGSSEEFRRFEEGIVNSYYWEFGHAKYAGMSGASGDVKLVGTGEGTFRLEVDKVVNGTVTQTYVYPDVPVVVGSVASTSIRDGRAPLLRIDVDNDGKVDSVIAPGEGLKPEELIGVLRGLVKSYELSRPKEARLLRALDRIEKTIEREFKKDERKKMVLSKQIKHIGNIIVRFGARKLLTAQEVKELQEVLSKLQSNA